MKLRMVLMWSLCLCGSVAAAPAPPYRPRPKPPAPTVYRELPLPKIPDGIHEWYRWLRAKIRPTPLA